MIINTNKTPFTPAGGYIPLSVTRGPNGRIVSCARDGNIRAACRLCIFRHCCRLENGAQGERRGHGLR